MADVIDFTRRKKISDNADAIEIAEANPEFHTLDDESKTLIFNLIRRILDSLGKYSLPNLEGLGLTGDQIERINMQCIGSYQNMVNGMGWILGGFITLSIESMKRQDDEDYDY